MELIIEEPKLDPKKRLPPEVAIDSIDDILYRIGLCFTSVRDRPKRLLIDHPLFGFISMSLYIILRFTTMSISEDNHYIFILTGDIGYLIGVREGMGQFLVSFTSLSLLSQIIYYYNYKNGIKPTFLRVFQMMAGLIPPEELDLTDMDVVQKLTKSTRNLYKQLRFNNDVVVTLLHIGIVPFYYLNSTSPYEALVYGIPNGVVFMIWAHYHFGFMSNQFMVFFTVCAYLKLKINSLNESLLEMKRRKRFIRIRESLQSIDSLYSEINEYNTTYWSKILLVLWTTFGFCVSLFIFITIFIPVPLPIRCALTYVSFFISVHFLFIIFTASSVTYCVKKTYKTLNSFFISYSKHNKHNTLLKANNKLLISGVIERVALKKVGFSCWKLFTINYFRCYEIITMMACFFLKFVEIHFEKH